MSKKYKKKVKIKKTSLDRSPACSDARLKDWKHCVEKAFKDSDYKVVREHKFLLSSIADCYEEGYYTWVQVSIIGMSGGVFGNVNFIGGGFCPYKYNGRTVIFQ